MEHEVFVPVPAERLREALGDPARVARAVPGLQQDAGAEPVAGRLKVRVGSHSVTYRGAVRLTGRDDGSYTADGEATEARGTGSVHLSLTLRLRDTDDGTTLAFEATATADGRITELPQDAVGSAVVRLLNRFAEGLAEAEKGAREPAEQQRAEHTGERERAEHGGVQESAEHGEEQERAEERGVPDRAEEPEQRKRAEERGDPDRAEKPEGSEQAEEPEQRKQAEEPEGPERTEGSEAATSPDSPTPEPEETPAPREEAPAPLDQAPAPPEETSEPLDEAPAPVDETPAPPDEAPAPPEEPPTPTAPTPAPTPDQDFTEPLNPPAEAAHARRTMIGRSAEEVDHAPPRGRYAPVPAPQTVTAGATLRWAAPAAAVALASAIVVTRVLRKRR
ncbi:SRPBCC domain-containing protein [Streptomyces sp. BK205]|uniref:SRPBCC domain-containing protein n=1 Tax=Streptomyces sp. BK205 TaxID=2512164 RepID=UPI001053CE3B|nr:SRPBCC domain-containing protein [Streptomyces sp. BK205]TCR23828.1 carbon monoxide dehydrogenase subunit G [Streptomyces sp. BK205]